METGSLGLEYFLIFLIFLNKSFCEDQGFSFSFFVNILNLVEIKIYMLLYSAGIFLNVYCLICFFLTSSSF